MFRVLLHFALIAVCLLPVAANAEPIKLKLSFFSSDRAILYLGGVKPFIDAVNDDESGLIEIEPYFGRAFGKSPAEQPQLVRDGIADIAYIVPGYTAEAFPDNALIELPGLFRDQREATLVYTRMIAANALRGYEDFIVIGAFTGEPQCIHTSRPVLSLADLKGLTIRVNNPIEASTFEKLGMRTQILPVNKLADAISSKAIDGAAVPNAMLAEFGVGRLTSHHYMIYADAPTLALVMSQKRFEALPAKAQELIRKYSGEWLANREAAFFQSVNTKAVEDLQADPRRKVVFPSPSEHPIIQAAFRVVIDRWAAEDPRNGKLLAMAEAEIARLRAGQ